MAYAKRTSGFEWAGKSLTFTDGVPEMNAKRVQDKYRVHNNIVHERRIVYRFTLSDVEDPELYAAIPLKEWEESEHGQWVMKHTLDPTYHINADYAQFGYTVVVTAHIEPKRWTEYCLRFDKHVI